MTETGVVALAPPSVWRRRDFRLAWGAGLVNDTGDWVLNLALPVYVFTQTGSGTATALLFVCQVVVSMLLGPLGGSIVDRLDLRRCLIATNTAQAAMLLPLLAVSADRIWPAYLVVTGQAMLTQINNPANVALLPRLVETEQLTVANAALGASVAIARLVGAPLGGLLVAVGGLTAVVVIDLASFLAVAVGVAFIRTPTPPLHPTVDGDAEIDGNGSSPRSTNGVRDGLREMGRRPKLRGVLTIFGFAQIAQGGFVVLFVVFLVERLGRSGTEIGVIRGTMAIGAVAGSILIARRARGVDPVRLVAVGYLGMGVVSLMFWNAPYVTEALWVYIVLFAASGVPGSALSVGLMTVVQTESPAGAVGRVAGVMLAAEALGSAIGAIGAGLLVDTAPLGLLLSAQATVYLVSAALVARLSLRGPLGRDEDPFAGERTDADVMTVDLDGEGPVG